MFAFLRLEKLIAGFRASAGQTSTFGVLSSFDMAWKWRNTSLVPAYSSERPLLVETPMGNTSPQSLAKTRNARPICLSRQLQLIFDDLALKFAREKTASVP